MQTLRANNSRIVKIQNAKFSGYYIDMNTKIWRDFQICISVPLSIDKYLVGKRLKHSIFVKEGISNIQ